jgi:hypothetical protein
MQPKQTDKPVQFYGSHQPYCVMIDLHTSRTELFLAGAMLANYEPPKRKD